MAGPTRTKRKQRGRNQTGRHLGITRDEIVAAAVEMSRKVGLEGVTITRLCEQLNVTPPTIYHHVRNKDELLTLAVDAVLESVPLPGPEVEGPGGRIAALMVRIRAELLAHRGLAIYMVRHEQPPSTLRFDEYVLSELRAAGLSRHDAAVGFRALSMISTGYLLRDALIGDPPKPGRDQAPFFPRAIDETTYPEVAAARRDLVALQEDPLVHDVRLLIERLTSSAPGRSRRKPR